jgi:hypothetical protein
MSGEGQSWNGIDKFRKTAQNMDTSKEVKNNQTLKDRVRVDSLQFMKVV